MKINLKNIIDLDYLTYRDDTLDSKDDIRVRELKDRKIYNTCHSKTMTDKNLLLLWLKLRKNEKKLPLLPGTLFSSLYTSMIYIMAVSGFFAGISTVYSFLIYHGNRPVNVTSFTAIFIVLQAALVFLTLMLILLKVLKHNTVYTGSIIQTLVSSIFFSILPKIIKKADWVFTSQNLEHIEHTISFLKIKSREYNVFFFWHFYILTSLFAFSFATGTLGGIFFKVIASDMAFGWQSTLIASSHNIHDIVSFIALPWSWFISDTIAIPTIEQIEGSRIILKQGISVLATQNLVSWWPFLCFGILFYAVIPRGLLLITGIFFQKQALKKFSFSNPKFRQLIARMKSPVVSIDTQKNMESQEALENKDIEKLPLNNNIKISTNSFPSHHNEFTGNALLLAAQNVYSQKAMKNLVKGIRQQLLYDIKNSIEINLDIDNDANAIVQIGESDANLIILVHEVWQPPIRELVYNITMIKASMPENIPLYILLTSNSDQENLGVDKNDINFKVWEKVVYKLEDPGISVIRFLQP
jgi:hypothetical protein